MQDSYESALNDLTGKSVVSVCFVLNYVTLQFGSFVLAALALPSLIEKGSKLIQADDPDYRNALCRQIGKVAIATQESPQRLEILLEDDTVFVVSLSADHPPGPEMALMSTQGRFLQSWLKYRPRE